ncbi:hypothetical protein D9753_01165 [Streptomyces dangxiongensis]|uniref:LysR substrate-binding domain-containing protein n=1 Tax=Streptomyces dangxiongensis TaxID=1442032 RepID=A0A3G2J6I0_9ACTN|nr:hypothetical protein D9753_01165 [Streptomyces dangxiongensis]
MYGSQSGSEPKPPTSCQTRSGAAGMPRDAVVWAMVASWENGRGQTVGTGASSAISPSQRSAVQKAAGTVSASAPPPGDDPDLLAAPLLEDPLLLALPVGHPLADRAELSPQDLDGRPWIAVENPQDPSWRGTFVASCAASGFTPDIRMEAAEPLTALGLVASGLGLALVQQSMVRGMSESVAVRELPWHRRCVQLWATWHRVDLRPVVASFRATVLRSGRTGR